jgi:hypothetical protein
MMRGAIAGLLASQLALGGCSSIGGSVGSDDPGGPRFPEREIEESDLYRLEGDLLYVQNPSSGLHAIDVSEPDDPVTLAHHELAGEAGEIYVRGDLVLVVFRRAVPGCPAPGDMPRASGGETSEVVAVASAASTPETADRLCLPGVLVASRLVGDVLYAITTEESSSVDAITWVASIDVSVPGSLVAADHLVTRSYTHEVLVTDEAVFLAQHAGSVSGCWSGCTRIGYVDISDPSGDMSERGSVVVQGTPPSRHHMDAAEDTFRIVTDAGAWSGSSLYVIDIRMPDRLVVAGSLEGIAWGEDLHATRFVGDTAYIVTYRSRDLEVDPLWIVSLEDPGHPEMTGHLEVPGWSDWIFPRGDRLLAVGRGDRGAAVAVSLFDVSDPTKPEELRRLEFGEAEATSEANLDFRGVSVLEDIGDVPLVAVPYTNNTYPSDECVPEHYLQLIDILDDDLVLQGTFRQEGRIRRTFERGGRLYSLSDRTVSVLDVSDRASPTPVSTIDLAAPGAADPCITNDFEIPPPDPEAFSYFGFGCSQAGHVPRGGGTAALVCLALACAAFGTGSRRCVRAH